MGKVWFVTGASRGFGRLWSEAALERGDSVVATARDVAALEALKARFGEAVLPLQLDVTDREAVFRAVEAGHARFGRLDVVVANAGYGLVGMIEELRPEAVRQNLETNVFGTLSLVQAALPYMRAQGGGHVLLVASAAGLVTFPRGGAYQAGKFAVVALGETLAQEAAGFGVRVTVVEPGPFATDFSGSSLVEAEPLAAYDGLRAALGGSFDPADFPAPELTVAPVLGVVDAAEPPLHLLLGPMREAIDQAYAARVRDWDRWAAVRG